MEILMKTGKTLSKLAIATLLGVSLSMATSAHAVDGSVQALGGWWHAGDSGDTYSLGLRGSLGSGAWTADLGWMSYGEGDDIEIDVFDYQKKLGGIKANVFDLGLRYTFPLEIYVGGGLSYFDFDYDVEIDGEWGFYGLVGWSVGGEHIRAFIEGMYRYTEGTIKYVDSDFIGTNEVDVDSDGLAANVGIMYRF